MSIVDLLQYLYPLNHSLQVTDMLPMKAIPSKRNKGVSKAKKTSRGTSKRARIAPDDLSGQQPPNQSRVTAEAVNEANEAPATLPAMVLPKKKVKLTPRSVS
jgi:hypothetical protein